MSPLRDNQALRREIVDIIIDGLDSRLVLARVSERILGAVAARALAAVPPRGDR